MRPSSGQLCERARQWASLRVDGELSELESALLDAHLGGCADCRAFATDLESVTFALRATEFAHTTAPVILARSRHGGRRTRVAAQAVAGVAALLALMMVGGALGVHSLTGRSGGTFRPTAVVASSDPGYAFRSLRRAQLVDQVRFEPRNRLAPIGSA